MKNKIWLFGLVVLLSLIPIAVLAQNQPPVADAGLDRNAYTAVGIILNGSATDLDGNPIVEWGWTVEVAPNSSWRLVNWDTPSPLFSAVVPGDYVLSLRVADAYFQSAPDFVTIHVADNLPPVAVATADKTTVSVGEQVCFDGSQSYDPEGAPLSYIWNFGDGSPEQGGVSLCHLFNSIGTFDVTLTAIDERNAFDLDVVAVTVNPPANHPPVASPTASPNTGDAPLTVQFTANASDPDNDPLTFTWDFGDPTSPDNTSNLSDPEHIYMHAGTYVAQLTVSDGNDSASYSLTITVEPSITLSVCTATVKWWNAQKTMGAVSLWAGFDAEIPARGDMVAIYFDNIQLFAAPFSKFKHGLLPGAYWLTKNSILVRFDFTNNQLLVVTPKMNLVGLDNVNGVDVELMIGSDVATENIMMKPAPFNRLIYRSPDCLGEPQ